MVKTLTNINRKNKLTQNNPIWLFFSSVKLSVFLLLTLAGVSVFGTFIPQEQSFEFYRQTFGELWGTIIPLIGLDDCYHSTWYRLLMGLLCLNIIVCSVERLQATWRIIFPKDKTIAGLSRFRKDDRISFNTKNSMDHVRDIVSRALASKWSRCELKSTDTGFYFYGETGRKSRLGVYAVHLSILVMVIGGLIGSFLGFDGHIQIIEGNKTNQLVVGHNKHIELPFTIQCNDFSVSFYENGSPSEFKSILSLIRNEKVILTQPVLVNHPLRYEGINIFQSSYGLATPEYREEMPETVVFHFQNRKTHLTYPVKASLSQRVPMPEGKGFCTIQNYQPSYQFGGHQLGPTLMILLETKSPDSEKWVPKMVMLPVQYHNFDHMRQGHFTISIMNQDDFQIPDDQKKYYTGLQVTSDPGIWFVYTGFIIMLLGIFVTFFVNHRQFLIEVIEQSNDTCQVFISGVTNKNKPGMKLKLERLRKDIQQLCLQKA